MEKKYYITTPIYYVNDKPHIGHAYCTLCSDILGRFKKLDGYEVKFLTGTDEHGQKVEKSALKENISPQELTDKYSKVFRDLIPLLNLSCTDFIRTTEQRHKDTVKDVWNRMLETGDIYLDKYSGWYCVRDEAFYAESELVDGKAPTGAEVEWVEEESYFFKLSKYEDALIKLYEDHPEFIQPQSRKNEVISFVKGGLRDLSVSRTSFNWGIQVPNNPSHVIYVWLDALFNYYSAVNNDSERDFWPADIHVVGKDILRFHAVYWPAFLMSVNLPLPKQIFAHGWWLVEGEKMSKSLGNTLDPFTLVEKYGVDYVRYFLVKEINFGNDGSFSQTSFVNRINSELCNNIGNLSQRVLSFVYKNCDAKIPAHSLQAQDSELLNKAYSLLANMRKEMDKNSISSAIDCIVNLGNEANVYVDKNAPWALKKTDPDRMNTVLYTLCECIRILAIALQAVVPDSANKMLNILNLENQTFDNISTGSAFKVGHEINPPEGVFPRLES